MTSVELESPDDPDDLYLARGDEIDLFSERPLFTGDVLTLADGCAVSLLQHPCSMRYGLELVPNLIVADVKPWSMKPPSDWTQHAKRMFLPEFQSDETMTIDFVTVKTISSDQAKHATRTAILSQRGVNLLLQRWVNHLTRVVVPTASVHESIAAEHEEADLIGEMAGDLVTAGIPREEAGTLVDNWLNTKENGKPRRARLRDKQAHSALRRGLRHAAQVWIADHSRPSESQHRSTSR